MSDTQDGSSADDQGVPGGTRRRANPGAPPPPARQAPSTPAPQVAQPPVQQDAPQPTWGGAAADPSRQRRAPIANQRAARQPDTTQPSNATQPANRPQPLDTQQPDEAESKSDDTESKSDDLDLHPQKSIRPSLPDASEESDGSDQSDESEQSADAPAPLANATAPRFDRGARRAVNFGQDTGLNLPPQQTAPQQPVAPPPVVAQPIAPVQRPALQRRANFAGPGAAAPAAIIPPPRPTAPAVATPQAPSLDRAENSQSLSKVKKLPAEQRLWSDNVLRVLKLPSKTSQARVIAGAVASAEMVNQSGSGQDKQAAGIHLKTVLGAGEPPWKDASKAMAATSAKVQLDLLSIPPQQRQLQRLGADGDSANKTYWINRMDAAGKPIKAFLCKPANIAPRESDGTFSLDNRGVPDGAMASGGPKGGEVAREALSGRAAQMLAAQTGIDIGMPETHVVKLDPQFIPGGKTGDPQVTCSVQEARPATGDLKGADLSRVSPDQVAGLAIFDTITLNCDRHAGNVLLDAGGNLIPIDHGESFAEANQDGMGRIKASLAGPHNALLAVPSAHEPLSDAMAKKLSALKSSDYADGLSSDRNKAAAAHGDMKDMISDEAIRMAGLSARFVKLAAKSKPGLSPAAIQVALGSNADVLFDPALVSKVFEAKATQILQSVAANQDTIKGVCLLSDSEYEVLRQQVEALGWPTQQRGTVPVTGGMVDPVAMVSIVEKQERPRQQGKMGDDIKKIPRGASDDVKAAIRAKREAFNASEKQADQDQFASLTAHDPQADPQRTLMAIRQSAVQQLLAIIPANQRTAKAQAAAGIGQLATDAGKVQGYGDLSRDLTTMAQADQTRRFAVLERDNDMPALSSLNVLQGAGSYANLKASLHRGDVLASAVALDQLEAIASADGFIAPLLTKAKTALQKYLAENEIDDDDDGVETIEDSIGNRDPAAAMMALEALRKRVAANEFAAKT